MPNFKVGDRVYHRYGKYTATITAPYPINPVFTTCYWYVIRDDGKAAPDGNWVAHDIYLDPAEPLSPKRSVDIALDRVYNDL